MPIRAVCFDLGGVLVRISQHWAEMIARCGLSVPGSISPADGLAAMPQFEAYQAGKYTDSQFLDCLATYIGSTREDALRVHESMLVEPYPGTTEFVQGLRARGLRTGCLSNTNEIHWRVLTRMPALQALDVRLASHEIGHSKPDPEAYREFEKAIGFAGDEILFFDDSPANVVGAARLGWQAHAINSSGNPVAQMRSFIP